VITDERIISERAVIRDQSEIDSNVTERGAHPETEFMDREVRLQLSE